MLTLEQAAKTLGMTPRQLRRRLEATAPLLAPYLGRGEKNKLLLDYGAIKILQEIEARRANGRTLREAIELVAVELRGKQRGELGQDSGQTEGELHRNNGNDRTDATTLLIEELRNRIRFLEEENRRLWGLVEDLKEQLALPRPRPSSKSREGWARFLWIWRRRAA